MHRPYLLLLAGLLLLGCVMDEPQASGPESPAQEEPDPPKPSPWARFSEGILQFEYPAGMEAGHAREGPNGRVMISQGKSSLEGASIQIIYTDIAHTYGPNSALVYSRNPNAVASDLLSQDIRSDPMEVLSSADDIGPISTFTLSRDILLAQATYGADAGAGEPRHGYAISMYLPERGLHINVRMSARGQDDALMLKDAFLLTFRLR